MSRIPSHSVTRPTAVLVIAILSIMGGSFGFCWNGVFSSAPFTVPALETAFDEQDAQAQLVGPDFGRTWPEVVRWAVSIPFMVLSALSVVAGVGLLGMRPWARRLILVCACVLLFVTAADGALAFFEWANTKEQLTEDWGQTGWLLASPLILGLQIVYGLVQVAFAVVVLVILLKPSVT